MTTLFLALIAIIIIACVALNNISAKIGIPTLLAFILLGIFVGNASFIPLEVHDHDLAKDVCSVALIFIMFYGGFGTRWTSAKPVAIEAGLLASLGVIITSGLIGLFCHYAFLWSWSESLLLGAVVGSTDAASVFSILRGKKLGLRNNTAPMLEVESGSNDPMSYMLTVLMLGIMRGESSGVSIAWMLISQVAFGVLGGLLIAKASSWVLEHFRIKGAGFDSLFLLAVAILAYSISDAIGGNGYFSAYLVGIILGNGDLSNKKSMVNFFDGITDLMQVLIFFLLGLLARPSMFPKVIIPALAIFVFMLCVARPVAVGSILAPFGKYPAKQIGLISFVGLRGAASIVFAIMATSGNDTAGVDIFNIVFCIVLISILFQGSLIPLAAKKLDMVDSGEDVMKTFNDYSEDTQLYFTSLEIEADSPWAGKNIRDISIPKKMLIAMILRGETRIIAKGDVTVEPGDKAILVAKAFVDDKTFLVEKTVKPGGKRDGKAIKDVTGDGLILLVTKGDEEFVPDGDTILNAGDRVVLLRHALNGKTL